MSFLNMLKTVVSLEEIQEPKKQEEMLAEQKRDLDDQYELIKIQQQAIRSFTDRERKASIDRDRANKRGKYS